MPVKPRGFYAVHTYTASASGLAANTHILELPNEVHLLDAQYALPYATEGINWEGAHCIAVNKPSVGDLIPDTVTAPPPTKSPAGRSVRTACCSTTSRLGAPNWTRTWLSPYPRMASPLCRIWRTKTCTCFVAEGDPKAWKGAVEQLLTRELGVVLSGHGLPGGREVLEFTRNYLAAVIPLLQQVWFGQLDIAGFKSALVKAFPTSAVGLLDIQNEYLFPQG